MANDTEEQLEVCKADALQLEREVRKLRAVLARVADYVAEEAEEARDGQEISDRFAMGRARVAGQVAHLVDGAADPAADLSPLSGLVVNGVRQTWQQVAADREQKVLRLEGFALMLSDLDRSRAGRHEGDVEGGAVSLGNPHLATGQTIGYSLGGRWAYVVPEPRLRGDLDAWKVRRP